MQDNSSPGYDKNIVWPKITVVTPSYNQGSYLEKAIRSVLDQNYPNLEYIVIDGGSNDNSVEVIKKYEKHVSYWVSEKDKGQSHAINKGLQKFTGDIFNWLCSDDYLEPGSLKHIAEAFINNKNCHCYAGKLQQVSPTGTLIGHYDDMLMPLWEDTVRLRVLKQPAVFFSRQAVEKMGPLNEDLHYCMDADWLYRFFFLFNSENIVEDKFLIAGYLLHDSSKSASQVSGFITEIDSIIHFFAKNKDLTEYASLLESTALKANYKFPDSIFDKADRPLVQRIVFYYLLRKSTKIYAKHDFIFAKRFLAIGRVVSNLKPDELKMMAFLDKYVKGRTWFSFRLRRAYLWKIKNVHLSYE